MGAQGALGNNFRITVPAAGLTQRTVLFASRAMRKNAFLLLSILVCGFVVTGCVSTVDGRKKAANPFVVKDKLVRVYDRPVVTCWEAVKAVLGANGVIIHEDVMQSTITARVDTRTVLVKTEAVDPKMTRVTTQVRTKWGNSDLDLAGELDKQIALRLATGALPVGAK